LGSALKCFEKALMHNPHYFLANKNYAFSMLYKNNLGAARNYFEKAQAIHPFDPDVNRALEALNLQQ